MHPIIICENTADFRQSLTALLCTRYPVRLFPSTQSLAVHLDREAGRPERERHLINVLVDLDSMAQHQQELHHIISEIQLAGLTFVLSSRFSPGETEAFRPSKDSPRTHYLFDRTTGNNDFLAMIDALITTETNPAIKKGQSVKYKNVEFFYECHQIRFHPNMERESIPPKETKLLLTFLKNPGQEISRENLMKQLWGTAKVSPRSLDSHISRLRKRIADSGLVIASEYGGGYSLE